MNYPSFFNQVKSIKVTDPLSEFLGTFESGIIDYTYAEIVKAAGHSCPTVAGAYLMCAKALEKLYPNELPVRGQIKVELKEAVNEDVTGVISNVISHITGATKDSGFKGIAGQFARHSLMAFNVNMKGIVRFTRSDTNTSVELDYNPAVPAKEEMMILMQKSISGQASESEKIEFGNLWQARVEEILIRNFDNPDIVVFI